MLGSIGKQSVESVESVLWSRHMIRSPLHCFIRSYCSLFAARLSRYTSHAFFTRNTILLEFESAPLAKEVLNRGAHH